MSTPPRVLVVLPYDLMARNFIDGGVLAHLAQRRPLDIVVVSPDPDDAARVAAAGARWTRLFHPLRWSDAGARPGRLRRAAWYLRYLAGFAWRMTLVYRFNVMQGFRGFAMRLRHSRALRRKFIREGLPMSRLFGAPFSRSRRLYGWLYRAYYAGWQRFSPVDRLFAGFRPQLVVLGHLQNSVVTPYVVAARRSGVPIVGINGSWDQPTTKGPLCPGVVRLLVQNAQVRDELNRYHGVPRERMREVGWPQMDIYADAGAVAGREAFLARLGYGGERYILFAANPGRLSLCEPEIAAWLAERLEAGRFGSGVRLHLRCHPNDREWQLRFGALARHPRVTIEPPGKADLAYLANLIRHAELVVASAGSMNLDAVALDTPTIGLAWEDESLPYADRPARAYELEHLAAVAQEDGLPLARTFAELEGLIDEGLADRQNRAEGRRRLRRRFVEPLDGRASVRVAEEIVAVLEGA